MTRGFRSAIIDIEGLLRLVAVVEKLQAVHDRDNTFIEEGSPACPPAPPSSVPPVCARSAPSLWGQLPPSNRRRLLRLLSQMLERQVRVGTGQSREASHDDVGGRTGGHADGSL